MVYVDELKHWGIARHRCFRAGSSHLTADTLPELHAMAQVIGQKREWFQDHPLHPHYDLSALRRAEALRNGAQFIPLREQIIRRRQSRC